MTKPYVYKNIKKYLKNNFIKNKLLAKALGYSDWKVSRILKGEQQLSFKDYAVICKTLNEKIDFFLNDFENDNKEV